MQDYHLCGGRVAPLGVSFPVVDDGMCCYQAAENGPDYCTCWRELYTLEQAPIRRDLIPQSMTPLAMCGDCAYRPGSPEKANDEHVRADADQLEQCVTSGEPFWCHTGMRRVIGYRHEPTGQEILIDDPAAFRPAMDANNVPYQADGTPAHPCSGWLLRRAKHLQEAAG